MYLCIIFQNMSALGSPRSNWGTRPLTVPTPGKRRPWYCLFCIPFSAHRIRKVHRFKNVRTVESLNCRCITKYTVCDHYRPRLENDVPSPPSGGEVAIAASTVSPAFQRSIAGDLPTLLHSK